MTPREESVAFLLPRGSVVGTLSNIENSIKQIEKPLTNDQKREKVLSELKISENELLSTTQKTQLENLLTKYLDVFSEHKFDLGETDILEAEIRTVDEIPISEPPRRPPIHLLPQAREEIDQLLKYGIIEPSQSPYSAPTVIVMKKQRLGNEPGNEPGKTPIRICFDWRSLNKKTKAFTSSLPALDTVIHQIGGNRIYSSLD